MTIEEMWQESIKGTEAFMPFQIKILKKFFFCGVYSILREMFNNISSMEEETGAEQLAKLRKEAQNFLFK